jgi:MtfA peptidase
VAPDWLPLLAGVPLGLAAVYVGFRLLRRYGSAVRFRTEPIPPEWWPIVEAQVPIARRLAPADRERLLRYMQLFITERRFEGCGGLELTEEMKVTIAAWACLLVMNSGDSCYPRVTSVLVYPGTFVGRRVSWPGRRHLLAPESEDPERTEPLQGEAWRGGEVILGWANAARGGDDHADGENVVVHEFAHELDFEDGVSNGIPILDGRLAYEEWDAVMTREYDTLRDAVRRGAPPEVISAYGATNPAEYFAVATEAFFERPIELDTQHRPLYRLLRQYYRLDPAKLLA